MVSSINRLMSSGSPKVSGELLIVKRREGGTLAAVCFVFAVRAEPARVDRLELPVTLLALDHGM